MVQIPLQPITRNFCFVNSVSLNILYKTVWNLLNKTQKEASRRVNAKDITYESNFHMRIVVESQSYRSISEAVNTDDDKLVTYDKGRGRIAAQRSGKFCYMSKRSALTNSKGTVFHQDNSRVHTSVVTR